MSVALKRCSVACICSAVWFAGASQFCYIIMADPQPLTSAEQTQDQEAFDLGYAMAPLSRQQLELIIVKMCLKHPECVDLITAEVTKPADSASVRIELQNMFQLDGSSISEVIQHIEEILMRANDYCAAKAGRNGLELLDAVCSTFVSHCTDSLKADSLSDEVSEISVRRRL